MNKQELINKVAESAGISKAAAALAVNTITLEIGSALAKGDSVSLIGFGTFKVSQRAAREGRNPSTGATINIPARKAPVFVAGKALKEAVNSQGLLQVRGAAKLGQRSSRYFVIASMPNIPEAQSKWIGNDIDGTTLTALFDLS